MFSLRCVCCTCIVAPFCCACARAWHALLVACTFMVLSTLWIALGDFAGIALFCGLHAFSLHCMLLYPQRWLSLLGSLLSLFCLLPLLCFVAYFVFVVGVSGFQTFLSLFALFALAAWLALHTFLLTHLFSFFSHPVVAHILFACLLCKYRSIGACKFTGL